jgi:acetyl-CoA carboxylase biotin carboxylase subunit
MVAKMFEKILIANRGEIAVRVIRSCKEMGIVPVTVYSECDRTALHVTQSYESHPIGPSPSKDSYLNIERILDAARKSGADAIHPGYGFLAENADFAEACRAAGVQFIGPSPESIRMMGNKLVARQAIAAAGVRLIPGSDGPVGSAREAAKVARTIGYPVIMKAAAGGGGKGMRIVRAEKEFESALKMTTGEAESAFGDAAVYIEKYIDNPKHIEIQVMADRHGNIVTYGERECSMQRRYQKVIEEAPSPVVSPEMRAALSKAARKVAAAANYECAGTVEFIVDENLDFYFLEMNTRLQVEHPVTELVYGVDLVKQQIEITAGKRLMLDQASVVPHGHAIEMRLYAEDPANYFLPSVGEIRRLTLPEGPGVRNENGVYAGYTIPIYYDPLIGKLVVWAESRPEAIRRAYRALRECLIDGVRTNVDFMLWALREKGFEDGSYDTHYIERHFDPNALHRTQEEIELASIAASITAYNVTRKTGGAGGYRASGHDESNPWRRIARTEGLRRPRW